MELLVSPFFFGSPLWLAAGGAGFSEEAFQLGWNEGLCLEFVIGFVQLFAGVRRDFMSVKDECSGNSGVINDGCRRTFGFRAPHGEPEP